MENAQLNLPADIQKAVAGVAFYEHITEVEAKLELLRLGVAFWYILKPHREKEMEKA